MRQSRRNSWVVIIVILLLSLGSVWTITGMKFSYDFEAFFPQDDPETDFYLAFRETFERDNDFYIIALENPSGVFQYDFLAKVDSLTNALKQVDHVREVIGPTQLEGVELGMLGEPITYPLLNWRDSTAYEEDSLRIMRSDEVLSRFFSRDGKALAIQIKHDAVLSKAKSDGLADDIARVVQPFQFHRVHSIGRVLGQKLYVELMLRELILFISLSLLLTIVFLYIAFRSAWGIIIPTLVVLISIIFTIGFIGLLGRDLDLMLTILPTILFVVGMSDSVHVLTKYMQELRNGRPKAEAIRYAFKSIRLATFLTALTTSVGFLTLVLSNIQPISHFGIYTAVGIMLAYGLTYTMLPAILLLAEPKRLNTFALSDDFWTRKLHGFFAWILRYRARVVWGTLIVLLISAIGISTIEVDNKMLEDLRDDHILKQEFAYLENQFTGCRPFELSVQLPQASSIRDTAVLRDMNELHHYLEREYGVRDLMS
ncbi:MAG: efflux RND transporter permease subunit, partial [Flavobacteriales bacterium]